ncbi:hypothetical protein [Acidianus sp. HS-5]|uniref:hypothetical protein n=1 Tax=Acidianus sp. HS-5 TaxID=2886040 RepID=UPI001F4699E5|nr:hypothetical protein [Acidianus sp. HS-5]BDC17539.1 hypothetical protein HS5_04290 [Acidianus sp. HS-5]
MLKQNSIIVGIVGGVLSFIWAYDHIPLYNLSFLPYGIRAFFVIDSVISILAGVVMILLFKLAYIKILYILNLVYWWINYLLLTLTRVLPAPLIGKPLPNTGGPALIAFILDILLIIVSTVIVYMSG